MKKEISKLFLVLSVSAITANTTFAATPAPQVTLYQNGVFNGNIAGISETLSSGDYLKFGTDTQVPNDQLTSLTVPQGCTVTLYENFNKNQRTSGDSKILTEGDLFLGRNDDGTPSSTEMANDSVSSMTVLCEPITRGISLFEHGVFNGNIAGVSEAFGSDDPDLGNNAIGLNTVTSIKVDVGCSAVLYTEKNFGGDFVKITADTDLRDIVSPSVFGHDNVSSIKVSCVPIAAPEVILYHDHDQAGFSDEYPTGDYVDFHENDQTDIGNNTVSSVHVPTGCTATIYEDPNFEQNDSNDSKITLSAGNYNFPQGDINDNDNYLGDNVASSMKVDCGTDPE